MSFWDWLKGKTTLEMGIKEGRAFFSELRHDKLERIKANRERLESEWRDAIERVKENLNELLNARLLNENIPEREKNLMEGNRRAYAHQVGMLLNQLEREGFRGKAQGVREKIEGFFKATFKSYQVLTFFLETEVTALAKGIRNLERILSEEQKLAEGEALLERVSALFEQLAGSRIAEKEKKTRLREIELELSSSRKHLESVRGKLQGLRESAVFREAEALRQKLDALREREQELRKSIELEFSYLGRLLRKYHRLKPSAVSEQLLENPVAVCAENPEQVAAILEESGRKAETGEIPLKPEEREKLLRRLRDTDIKSIENRLSQIQSLRQEAAKISTVLSENTLEKQAAILMKDKEEAERRVAELTKGLEKAGAEQAGFNPSLIKEELSKLLSILSNKKIVVI